MKLARHSAYEAACVSLADRLDAEPRTLDGPLARHVRDRPREAGAEKSAELDTSGASPMCDANADFGTGGGERTAESSIPSSPLLTR